MMIKDRKIADMNWEIKRKLFQEELSKRGERLQQYLMSDNSQNRFRPKHMRDAVYNYLKLGGKRLRPAILLFSCGAVGGDEEKALPAALAIELYHTWTLVHDDIIDSDKMRRGGFTVHESFRKKAIKELGYNEDLAKHYGTSIAILAGDEQHGWSISLLSKLFSEHDVDPVVVLYLINDLETQVLNTLIEGETLDIQYSRYPIESLDENLITKMLWKKTGVLYEFSAKAGAMIGLNTHNSNNTLIKAIARFASKCGTAFQLQDDILGVVGDEDKLGKPVGSDITEGKRTTITYYSFKNANERQKEFLSGVLGNDQATEREIKKAIKLLRELGGIDRTKKLAKAYIKSAKKHLEDIPESKYKDLLSIWAEYMIKREF